MKKRFSIFFCMMVLLCFCACSYHPPEGWTRRHHTYNEVNAFAKSIDPNAVVAEEYTDYKDKDGWIFREWDAVINGVDCHVSSVSSWVWNEGFCPGEVCKTYYRIDTDYDYTILNRILSEHYPDWEYYRGDGSVLYDKYYNPFSVKLTLPEYRKLNDDELEQVWQTVCSINEEYEATAVSKKIMFCIPSPGKYWDYSSEKYFVRTKGKSTYIEDLTEVGKKKFFQEYQENWALLDSGLPVRD